MTITTFKKLESTAIEWKRLEGADKNPRNEILKLGCLMGELCHSMLLLPPANIDDEKKKLPRIVGATLLSLVYLSSICRINLFDAILAKLELNAKKYPVELCKGQSEKYTTYSHATGITKTQGQSTLVEDTTSPTRRPATSDAKTSSSPTSVIVSEESTKTLEAISQRLIQFARERDWDQFHQPRNLCLALMGEMGELAEIFQWKGDNNWEGFQDEKELDRAGQELADCAIYLIRLATKCQLDLGSICSTMV
jgi:dCTP diphosphatase